MNSNEYFKSITEEINEMRSDINTQNAQEVQESQLLALKGIQLGGQVDALIDKIEELFKDF